MDVSAAKYCRALSLVLATGFVAGFTSPGSAEPDPFSDRFRLQFSGHNEAIEMILSGDLDAGVEALQAPRYLHMNQSAAYNNLCVAYTINKHLPEAAEYCRQAVKASRREFSLRGTLHGSDRKVVRQNYALALSNQGVMFALTGNDEAARKNFHKALRAKPEARDEITHNLAALDTRAGASTEAVALQAGGN